MKAFKSFLALLLIVAMLLTLCACGDTDTKKHSDDDDEDEEEETSVTTTVGDEEEDEEGASKDDENAPTAEEEEPPVEEEQPSDRKDAYFLSESNRPEMSEEGVKGLIREAYYTEDGGRAVTLNLSNGTPKQMQVISIGIRIFNDKDETIAQDKLRVHDFEAECILPANRRGTISFEIDSAHVVKEDDTLKMLGTTLEISSVPTDGSIYDPSASDDNGTVDKTSIVGEWKGSIVLDDWLRAYLGTPTGEEAEVALMTKLYDVMIDNIALDYYMEFNEDGTAAWKLKETFVTDMTDAVCNNMAAYIVDGGVYELLATQGLDREGADAALSMMGMDAKEFGASLMDSMESSLQSSVTIDEVFPGGTKKDGFYIGLGHYEHAGDSVTFIGKDGTKQSFIVNLDKGTLTAKAFYLGGVAVGVSLSRV